MSRRQVRKQASTPAPTISPILGAFGYATYRNRSASLFIDDAVLNEFRGRNAERTIDRMLLDPVIAGIIERTALTLRSAPWKIEPPPENPTDLEKQLAERLAQDLDDLETGWASTVASMADALPWGFSLHEVLYRQDTDGFHWADFSPREQRSVEKWDVDDATGVVQAVWQRVQPSPSRAVPGFGGRVQIPGFKLLHFRTHPASGRPEGRALIRNAFIGWSDKQELRRLLKTGLRRDFTGVAKYEVPAELLAKGATPEQKAALQQAIQLVQEFERDLREGLVVPSSTRPDTGQPSGWKLELMQSGGRRPIDLTDIWALHNREIAIGLMAEFVLMGHEQVGTQALGGVKVSFFERAINAYLDIIAELMQKKATPVYQAFNPQFAEARRPRWTHGDVDKRALSEIGAFIGSVSTMLTPEPAIENWLRQQIDAPDIDVDAPLPDPGREEEEDEPPQPGDDDRRAPGEDDAGEQHEVG